MALFYTLYLAGGTIEGPVTHAMIDLTAPLWPARQANQVPPQLLIGLCLVRLAVIVAATWIVGLIDGRSWLDYGLRPWRSPTALGGALFGAAAVSIVVIALLLSRNLILRVPSMQLEAAAYGLTWATGMALVGLSEEMAFRGVPVILLQRAFGPGIAAVASALLFVYAHWGNSDENLPGLVQVGLFGLICAVSVIRTGSIWWAVAFHAAWNWTLEYVFGAVGSGYTFQGHLLDQDLLGPSWLTGGSAGLEGSPLAILVLVAIGIVWWSKRDTPANRMAAQVRRAS